MRKFFIFLLLAISTISMISCNQETPVAQQSFAAYSQDDAVSLYMLGNEAPIEAEEIDNFILNGPGPFFLWVLDLTDEQKEQLREIGEKHRAEMHELHMQARGEMNREDLRAQHEATRQAMMEEILSILTDEQKALLDQIQAQIEAGQYPDIVVEKRVAHLTELLNLDEDQQTAVKELMAEYGAKMLELRADQADPRQCHEEGRALMQEFRDAVKALLNEEQLALFEEMKAEFAGRHPHRGHRQGPGGMH